MRPETQRQVIRDVLAHAASGTTQLADASQTFPASRYVDGEAFDREAAALREVPHPVCLVGDVADAGDHVVAELADVSIVVVRGHDGVVRALVNSCRHRGAPLVEHAGAGARSFTCPFHGWVYDTEGTLVATPRAGTAFDDIDLDGCRLPSLPVADHGGVIYVGSRPTVDAVGVDLGEAAADLGDFDLASLQPWTTSSGEPAVWTSEWAANWKLLVDTFLESYHVPRLHRDTVARYYLAEPSTWASWPDALRFQTSQTRLLEYADVPEAEWDLLSRASVLYLLAPNTILSFSVDHLAWYRFVPLAVDKTRVECRLYGLNGSAETDPAHVDRTLDLHQRVSGGEDFIQQSAIHASLASATLDEVTFGRNEGPAIWFHEWVDTHTRPQGAEEQQCSRT